MKHLAKSEKERLDALVAKLYPQFSKTQIQAWIKQGNVTVDGAVVTKPGVVVAQDAQIVVTVEESLYVSRAGFKLEKALDEFGIDVANLIVLDAGLSTGGFTDCLLQRGVAKAYGIDVGHDQVHVKIKDDPRLVIMEGVNLRHLETLPENVDLVTLDLSFISVLKVMDTVVRFLKPLGKLIILVKPQFEAGRKEADKSGGIIKDPKVHQLVLQELVAGVTAHGFTHQATIESPILGTMGNKEFLAYFIKNS